MPASFTRSEVEAIAELANLALDEHEIELFARQLGDILDYARQLQQIDTTGVSPTATLVTRLQADRIDEVRPSLDRADAVANAPDTDVDRRLFRVPRIIG